MKYRDKNICIKSLHNIHSDLAEIVTVYDSTQNEAFLLKDVCTLHFLSMEKISIKQNGEHRTTQAVRAHNQLC